MIDELRSDPAERSRFLAACGLHGVLLALSQAGGSDGRRMLPLLRSDADWDALTDRVRDLVRELEDHDLARLLLAIADALVDHLSPAQRIEAANLAGYTLATACRTWDAAGRALPAGLLDAWHEVNSRLADPASPPQIGPTWWALHPQARALSSRAELAAAGEWLALAELLRDRDPEALARVGFPASDTVTLEALISAAENAVASADSELCGLAETVLVQIRSLAPVYATDTRRARAKLALDAAINRNQWWTPADLDAPPSDELAALRRRFDVSDVARVLRDL